MDENKQIFALIQEAGFCALATCGAAGPHCSLMSYVFSRAEQTLYLVTSRDTLKYKNIAADPRVSLLLDERGKGQGGSFKALTVGGLCRTVEDEKLAARLAELFTTAHPGLGPILEDPAACFLAVEITGGQLLNGPVEASFSPGPARP